MAEETLEERIGKDVDKTFSPYDVSQAHVEHLKEDLKRAFAIQGKARPRYEDLGPAGPLARTSVNLVDFVTDPLKASRKTLSTAFGFRGLPGITHLWGEAEEDSWRKLFTDPTLAGAFVDSAGNPIVPSSLQRGVILWNEAARNRLNRLGRQDLVKKNPGLTLMMARQLDQYYASLGVPVANRMVAGFRLSEIIASASSYEHLLNISLSAGDARKAARDSRGAERHYLKAQEILLGVRALDYDVTLPSVPPTQISSWDKRSEDYREAVTKEFEKISRQGGLSASTSAAQALANSPEAAFWRYWKSREQYFTYYNAMDLWREEGPIGMIRFYLFNKVQDWFFAPKKTFTIRGRKFKRDVFYPPEALSRARAWVFKKLRLDRLRLMDRLSTLSSYYARFWNFAVRGPIKVGLDFVRTKIVEKVLIKLGIRAAMMAAGTALPAIGNAIAAGLSVVVDIFVEKYVEPALKKVALPLFGACCGCAFLFGAAVFGTGIYLATYYAPGEGGVPGVGPGPAPPTARVMIQKEACYEKQVGGVTGGTVWLCANPTNLSNGDDALGDIRWQITITNTGSLPAQVSNLIDDECEGSWAPSELLELDAGEEWSRRCIPTGSYVGLTNTTIVNNVSGTATVGSAEGTISATGILNIGSPPTSFPDRWPTCGTITQGANVPCHSHGGDEAIDFSNVAGTAIYATHSGRVSEAGSISSSCGYGVKITATVDSTTFTSVYCHLSRVDVPAGADVRAGEQIGLMGSTGNSSGPHLHYELIGLPMIRPYIPQTVCCCREFACGEGVSCWDLYYGGEDPCAEEEVTTLRCEAYVCP